MPSKRIILMHISNVSGHRSASLAIENAIKIKSPQSKTLSLNAFNYLHPHGEKIINSLYMFVILRMPFIWSHLYDNPRWHKRNQKIKEIIHCFNLGKLEALFKNFYPDVIVSTQAFPCGMVADFKRIKGVNIPLVAVLTDFIPHSYWIHDNVNYYVVPSKDIKNQLAQKGVGPERIKDLGIPVDIKFNRSLDKARMRQKLNLDEHLFTVLIMGGGQGLGPIKKILNELGRLELKFQAIVVCGINKPLYSWVKNRLNRYKNRILLFGYTENVDELMASSDVIVTKPGGITCAEALSKGLPMLIISPIPGQETKNTEHLIKNGAGIKINNIAELSHIIAELYKHPQRLADLSHRALEISRPNAAGDIAEFLLRL